MIFTEEIKTDGYKYWTEDLFGELTIKSMRKILPDELDAITKAVTSAHKNASQVTGDLALSDGIGVTFMLKRKSQWEEDNENV